MGFGTRRVVDVEVSTMKVILSNNTFDFLDNTSPLFSLCLRIVPGKNVVARGVDRGDCSLAAGFHGYFSISSSQGSFLFFYFKEALNCTLSLRCFLLHIAAEPVNTALLQQLAQLSLDNVHIQEYIGCVVCTVKRKFAHTVCD